METIKVPLERVKCPKVYVPDAFLKNVKELGIVTPVTLLKRGSDYIVLAGRKRVNAARKAGMTEIPAVIVEENSRTKKLLISLSENIARKNSPLQEAILIEKLIRKGFTYKEVAKLLGISKGQVSKRLALLKLTDKLKRALSKGELPSVVAYKLARLPEKEQREYYQWCRKNNRKFSESSFEDWNRSRKEVKEKLETVTEKAKSLVQSLSAFTVETPEEKKEEALRVVCVCGEVFTPFCVEVEGGKAVVYCPSCGRKLTAKVLQGGEL